MPYIGKSPLHGNYNELTDVSGSFDGSTTQFALTENLTSTAITPVMPAALIISLNGVIQEPTTDYTVSGTNITFTTAPQSTDSFFGIVMGKQLDVGTPSDSTVTTAKLSGNLEAPGTFQASTITATTAVVPDASDGAALGTNALEWSDLFLADGAVINFGDDQDVSITHVADSGLTFKHTDTADDSFFTLTLQTGDTDIAADDLLGKITFQAPDEGTGTDAILVSGAIQARSEGNFSSSANATSLDFMTGASEAATTKMSLSSGGNLLLTTDGTVLNFGANSDVTATHVHDVGLNFASTRSGADSIFRFQNLADASASDLRLILQNGGTSGGDVIINLDGQATGATFSMGVDTSGDKFIITDADKGGFDGNDEVFTIANGGNASFYRNSTETGGQILISQAGTGDPNIQFSTAATSFMAGIDNSDSDGFKIDYGTTGTGAQTGFTLDTSGNTSVKRVFVEGVTNNTGGLFIGGTTVRNAAQVSADYTSAAQAGMAVNDTNSGNGGAHFSFLTGGTVRASITNNNNTAVAYNTSSDARLKENIRPIPNAVERLKALKPVKFDWIESGLTSEGFIAQEFVDEQLAKDMVTGDPDGDVEKNPMQIEYGRLTVLLTKALQESLEKIDTLEARIETLEGK